jgi:hypothetical protein
VLNGIGTGWSGNKIKNEINFLPFLLGFKDIFLVGHDFGYP